MAPSINYSWDPLPDQTCSLTPVNPPPPPTGHGGFVRRIAATLIGSSLKMQWHHRSIILLFISEVKQCHLICTDLYSCRSAPGKRFISSWRDGKRRHERPWQRCLILISVETRFYPLLRMWKQPFTFSPALVLPIGRHLCHGRSCLPHAQEGVKPSFNTDEDDSMNDATILSTCGWYLHRQGAYFDAEAMRRRAFVYKCPSTHRFCVKISTLAM
jgi:hypothetical protein